MSLDNILDSIHKVTPTYIKAITKVNGLYCDIYDRLEETEYSNARGSIASNNANNYLTTPTYSNIKMLVNIPVQLTYAGDDDFTEFDAYMTEQCYFITYKAQLELKRLQKITVNYKGAMRHFEIFKLMTIDGSQGPLLKYGYLSPLV